MEPRDDWYKFFTKDHDKADAKRRFADEFGQPPMHCFIDRGVLLVGPIPEDLPIRPVVGNAYEIRQHEGGTHETD